MDDSDSRISSVPTQDAPVLHKGPSDWIDPKEIGPYRIQSRLGEGGMGVVYLAEQVEPVRRRVALKLIKPGMDSRQVVARFEAERQALALMNHPNVARVYDAGTTERGLPYFVMEYVQGVPITAHCDQNKLALEERLRLFVEVCKAVQHAHQKGVIHRDLKPSNILVAYSDGQPSVKVIDFGVAKAIDRELTERSVFTHHGALVGTPEYMSPEQAEMGPQGIDTRTDIYSLGVVLYELLTGSLPFDSRSLRSAGLAEIHRIIREVEPPRPSTRLSTATQVGRPRRTDLRSLERRLRSDLDWIVMRCLEKDRVRRYDSASALADDVNRFLNNEPVAAGPPTVSYRARKFIRRHRAPVTAAILTLLALIIGLITTTWQWRRAETERRRAETSEAQSFEIAGQLVGVFHDQVAALPGAMDVRDQWAALAIKHLERLQQRAGDDTDLLLELATGWDRVGDVRAGRLLPQTGDLEGAEQAYVRARSLRDEAADALPARRDDLTIALAESGLRLGSVKADQEKQPEAIQLYDEGLDRLDDVPTGRHGAAWLVAHGRLLNAKAAAIWRSTTDAQQRLEAEKLARRSKENLAAAVLLDPTYEHRRALGRANQMLGEILWDKARSTDDNDARLALLNAAADSLTEAATVFEQLVETRPADVGLRSDLATSRFFEGVIRRLLDEPENALYAFRTVVRHRRYLAESDPRNLIARLDLAQTHEALALLLQRNLDRSDDAVVEANLGLEISGELIAERPDHPEYRRVRVGLLGRKVEALASLERFEQLVETALTMYDEADAWDEQYARASWAPNRVVEAVAYWAVGHTSLRATGTLDATDAEPMLDRISTTLARWGNDARTANARTRLSNIMQDVTSPP